MIDLHRERIKEKGRRFEDSSEEEEQDKPKTRAQKYKENQKKGEIIYQQKLSTKALANCYYCLQNEKISENIILSNGNHAMLLIPQLCISGLMQRSTRTTGTFTSYRSSMPWPSEILRTGHTKK